MPTDIENDKRIARLKEEAEQEQKPADGGTVTVNSDGIVLPDADQDDLFH